MRILAIGVGGAGSRIVDQLYYQDRRSSVNCISAIVIDTDGNFLSQLRNLPDEAKVFSPVLDPAVHFDACSTIDVDEVMSQVKKMDNVDIDAIFVFTGLGGHLSDVIPDLTNEIRKSYVEPVFAVCTLPYLREGRLIATKAADDLDMIGECVDGIFLFDNETWYKKIKASFETTLDEAGNPVQKPSPFGKHFPENPRDTYKMLNERISRQVGLLLRAGEFNESGFESAEIVLDAGEILNTLKGNGMTAIGYAIEMLPSNWLDPLERWRSDTYFSEGSHKRATRIVSLAKQAVYEDISIPCDLTSADKALVLIAGPSRELSMKGFQTVRKWIDSSIAGLEMRSGDYPVRNTRYVGIIIMLSGLHNIPRLEEIRKIREVYRLEEEQKRQMEEEQRILREDEMLLLSKGRSSEEKDNREIYESEHSPLNQQCGNLGDETPSYTSGYPEGCSGEYNNRPSSACDDESLEEEAWGLISGYSDDSLSGASDNTIAGADDRLGMNGEEAYFGSYELDLLETSEGGNFSAGASPSLNIADFLEDDLAEAESYQGSENYSPGAVDQAGINRGYSFVELLEDEEMDDYDDGGDNAGDFVNYDESEPISLTSREYVKKEEYEELKKEQSDGMPLVKKEKVHDDQIVISGKKEKKKDNNGINLPGRSGKTDLDMTRMTSVDMGKAPKDRIFGVGEIKGPSVPREKSDVARVGEKISIGGSVQRPTDKAFSGSRISGGKVLKPNDNTFSGGSISVGHKLKPSDNALSGGKVSVSPNIRAKEGSLSGGRLSIRPAIRPKDNNLNGKLSMGGAARKPKELLSGGVRMRNDVSAPKELLSGGVKMRGDAVKPRELISDDTKIKGMKAVRSKDESFSRAEKRLVSAKSAGAKDPEPGKRRLQVKDDRTPSADKKSVNKKSKSSFSSDSEDDDMLWL